VQQRREAVLEADEVEQVDGEPHEPGEEAGQPQPADRRHRGEPRDGRHRALVEVAEGLVGARPALGVALDLLGGVLAALDRDLRDTGQRPAAHVADDEDLGVAGERQVVADLDPAGAVQLRAALPREQRAERARRDTGAPDLHHGRQVGAGAGGVLDLDAGRVDVDDLLAQAHLDADAPQLVVGLRRQRLAERAEHLRRRVEQDDARGARVDVPEVAGQRAAGQLDDLPGHLDPGGSRADDDEGEPGVDGGVVGLELGHLERAEDAAAQLEGVVDGLHAGRVAREVVVAEVRLARAGGDDERVVRRHRLLAEHH
jgi:hypothetical protein